MQLATKLVSTRRGTLIAALLIALLAGASILLYLNSYRDSLKAQGALVTVLVAKQTIPKGTSGSVVASKELYTVTTIRESQLLEGAMSDPATLRDKVATPRDLRGSAADRDRLRRRRRLARRAADRPGADRLGAARLGPRPDRRDRARQPRRRLRRVQRHPARRRRQADQRRSGAADAAADPVRRARASRSASKASGSGATNVSLGRRRRQGGEARLRLGQRQGLAGAAAERGREGRPSPGSSRSRPCCSASRRCRS